MRKVESKPRTTEWLAEHGPVALESLFRAVVYHSASPILVAGDDGEYFEASVGAAKLLGLPREKLIGLKINDFVPPAYKSKFSQLWQTFLDREEQVCPLHIEGPNGAIPDVAFAAKANVLPIRHVIVVGGKTSSTETADGFPPWLLDYALYLLDAAGNIADWYSGAARIYGFSSAEAVGQPLALLYTRNEPSGSALAEDCARAELAGHYGSEGWHVKKDGSRFWANTITMALRGEDGVLHGFARVTRDFSARHDQDERLRRSHTREGSHALQSAIVAIANGELGRVPEVNDAFLELLGYTRQDLVEGRLDWSSLTPAEFAPLDEFAHEEGLLFGACTPYEKELLRKDGTRVPVLVVTAVLKLSPFRWISFTQDLRQRRSLENIESPAVTPADQFTDFVGNSSALRRVQHQVEVVAPTDATVLILGETGTGKELVARAIHRLSPRKKLPFVTLNCAAIPTGLLESELFGYERGAFTGALSQKIGRFEMAHRGTLFLDEVGDIPLDLQPKLLRALQEKSFERLGGTKTIPIDVRLLAATNRNLTQMMGDKLFRTDLYYRLKVFPITTPPLRDHPEDIPLLARHFTKKYSEKMGRNIDRIPVETIKALVDWIWPGNVRELENFIERSVILSRGPELRAPVAEIRQLASEPGTSATLEHIEREHIINILRQCGGVITAAASRLGMPRTTLNAMMGKLGISRKDI